MKILLGTHHLEVRAGSELFTAELASAFQARGHEVAVFTFFKGALADEITGRGIPVFDSDERETIARLTRTSSRPTTFPVLISFEPSFLRVSDCTRC